MSAPPDDRGVRRHPRTADLPEAVHWHEGMLLAPQHFQLTSQRAEALMPYHAALANPFHWGVLDLDGVRLDDDVLAIERVEAVLPDGLPVIHSPRDGRQLGIDLKPYLDDISKKKDHQTIFLAVAARQPGERFRHRYEYVSRNVPDENTGIDDLGVSFLHPRLDLAVADTLAESSVGIPIARVKVEGGALKLLHDYAPPWLRVHPRCPLFELCTRIADTLKQKAKNLSGSIVHDLATSHQAQLLETKLLVHSLVSAMPPLEVLLSSKVAHPFALYLALAAVAGNVGVGVVPEPVEPYDHDDPLRVFTKLEKSIRQTLDAGIRAPYMLRPFNTNEREFRVAIKPAWAGHRMLLGVTTPQGIKEQDVEAWVLNSVIVNAAELDATKSRRVIGVKREKAGDADVVPASGGTFFKLLPDKPLPPDDLVITSDDDRGRPVQIVLYVDTRS